MKVQIDTEKVFAEALAGLDDTYSLDYVSYDERLSSEQLQRVFDGEVTALEQEMMERNGEYHWQCVVEQILPGLVKDPVARAALRADPDSMSQLIEAIEERDDSTYWADMVRNTGQWSYLMRYRLGDDDSDNWDIPQLLQGRPDFNDRVIERYAKRLARTAGVDYQTNRDVFRQMVTEQDYYGGNLYVIWYGSPTPIIEAICAAEWTERRPRRRTITWTDPVLVLLDTWNGTGYSDRITGTVTKRWDPERCDTDDASPGYGWDKVASVVHSAHKCNWRLDYTATIRKASRP